MFKYTLLIFLFFLIEQILSTDLNVYPMDLHKNENNEGEFQVYVYDMDEIISMTLKNGVQSIDVNFEKIIISNCETFEFEKECTRSLIGCEWTNNNCSSAIQCDQLSSTVCERTTNSLKDICEWDKRNNKCKDKSLEIKSCNDISVESDCKTSLYGCQWSLNNCSSATQCGQLSQSSCDKVIDSLRDKCQWDSANKKCIIKINSCTNITTESDCKESVFGCQWSSNKCISAKECKQLSQTICEKSIYSLRDLCIWDNEKCKDKKLCGDFKTLNDCTNSNLGCQWYDGKCFDNNNCNQLNYSLCETTQGKFKDKCEWYTYTYSTVLKPYSYSTYCISKRASYLYCYEIENQLDCIRSSLGCYWYQNECIDADQCNYFSDITTCLNNTGELKDKCELYITNTNKYCQRKKNSAEKCSDNLNSIDCSRSILGCKWYKSECIKADQCSDFSNAITCLNNTGNLKAKCEWYTSSSYPSYCRGKQDSAKICSDNLNEDDCIRSILGCKWYKNECIKEDQCSDFSYFTTCLNNTGELKNKCEWDTSTFSQNCINIPSQNYVENCKVKNYVDCQKSKDCYWISEKCVLPTKCSDFNQTICENIESYSPFSDQCEWSEKTMKCQRKVNLYGTCSENSDVNECIGSLLGCAWVNNKCVNAHHCSALSQSVCENLLSNTILYNTCEWSEKTKQCQRKAYLYGLCSENLNENECTRSLIGCAWVNNKCINALDCSSLSSFVCENLFSFSIIYGLCEWNQGIKTCRRKVNLYGYCSENLIENDCSRSLLGCTWINKECVNAQQCSTLSQVICENITSNAILNNTCEWNRVNKKCQRKANLYGFCGDILDESDCSRSLLGCFWTNNKCVTALNCNSLSQSVCEYLMYNTILQGECQWDKSDKICLQKRNSELIRNLADDEVINKYKCNFVFPNIDYDQNFDLNLVDKNNKKASVSLNLIIGRTEDEFEIFQANGFFLKNNLFALLIFILLIFMIVN